MNMKNPGATPCVVFLFNSSRYAPQPWLDRGVHCVSVDYDGTDHDTGARDQRTHPLHERLSVDLSQRGSTCEVERQCEALGLVPAFVVSFAPCTDLAVSGSAHFERKRARYPLFQVRAIEQARRAELFGVPYVVENPVSVLFSQWRKPDWIGHPWECAQWCPEGPHPEYPEIYPEKDRYNKKTCLWLGNGAEMVKMYSAEDIVEARVQNPRHKALGGKSTRTKYIRSLTPRGLAGAICAANIHHVTGQRELIL